MTTIKLGKRNLVFRIFSQTTNAKIVILFKTRKTLFQKDFYPQNFVKSRLLIPLFCRRSKKLVIKHHNTTQ